MTDHPSKQTNTNKLPPLDFKKIPSESLTKSPKYYQKTLSDQITEWDQLQKCVFCQVPVSPRSRTRIIKKPDPIQLTTETQTQTQTQIPRSSEYCCNTCAQKIASYTFVAPDQKSVVSESLPQTTPRSLDRKNSSGKIPLQQSPLSSYRKSVNSDDSSEEGDN